MLVSTIVFAAICPPASPPADVGGPAAPKAPPAAIESRQPAVAVDSLVKPLSPADCPYRLRSVVERARQPRMHPEGTRPPNTHPARGRLPPGLPEVAVKCRDVKLEFDAKSSGYTVHATGPVTVSSPSFHATASKLSLEGDRLILHGKVAMTVRRPKHSPLTFHAERFEMQLASGKLQFRGGKMSFRIGLMR